MKKGSFGFEEPEDSPGFLLWKTTTIWQRLIRKALEKFQVTHPQFVLLAVLLWFEEHEEIVTQAMLIQKTSLDKMTVSASLRTLSSQGFVRRAEHTVDTRSKTVKLTKSGRTLIKKLVPIVEGVDEQFFAPFSARDLAKLNQLFLSLRKELRDE